MAYTPKTWENGEIIEAEELNHIEQGIAAADAAATGTGTIGTQQLADGSVTTPKIAPAAVTNDKLDQEAVDSNNIRTGAIITPLIYDGAVTLQKLGADVIAELDNKADIDGSYEGMTVGNAEQLVSTVGVEDSAPYTFRTTGGSADVGDRMNLKAVVGGTVAWNQLVQNGNFETADGWGIGTVSDNVLTFVGGSTAGTFNTTKSRAASVTANHVLVLSVDVKCSSANEVRARYPFVGNSKSFSADTWFTYAIMNKPTSVSQNVGVQFDGIPDANYYMRNFVMFDLTAMFGSTIADYIYALEQSNAGAGVAYFRKLFPKPYYAYNSGELLSVRTNLHRMVGFNAYNPTTGTAKVVGGNQYQITGAYTALSLDGTTITPDANGKFTPSANGTLTVTGGNGTTTCIHLKWDGERDGEYEPYVAHEYSLSDITLRGMLKLDANNNLYADGDRYLPDGTVERRYGIVDLGTLTWESVTTSNRSYYKAAISDMKNAAEAITTAPWKKTAYATAAGEYTTGRLQGAVNAIYVYNDGTYADADTFKTAMSGVYMVYELATPTTETADTYQQTQIVDDFGTEEFVDAAVEANERDVAVPVGNETVYKPNLRAKLEMAPDSPDGGDGDYIVRQTNGTNEYVNISSNSTISGLSTRCPACPTDTDGNFVLKATVSGGSVTYSWVSA